MSEQPTVHQADQPGDTMSTVAPATELTPTQRARLARAAARMEADLESARDRFRVLLVVLVDEGASEAAIARELGVSRQAVHDRIKRAVS